MGMHRARTWASPVCWVRVWSRAGTALCRARGGCRQAGVLPLALLGEAPGTGAVLPRQYLSIGGQAGQAPGLARAGPLSSPTAAR